MKRRRIQRQDNRQDFRRVVDTLGELDFFGECVRELLEQLVERSALVELEPGEILIREGDLDVTESFVLLGGQLRVESEGRMIIRLQRPGEVAGEIAVLHAPPRTADVIVEAPTTVLAVRSETIALPEFAHLAGIYYRMLAHSLADKLRRESAHSRQELDIAEQAAATDRLTGLANRKRLDEVLETLSADCDRGDAGFAVILLDIDHFKFYNDSNGHLLGDNVLSRIGVLLNARVGAQDCAARFGGEEFVIVLKGRDIAEATAQAEKLRAAIAAEPIPNAEQQPLGCLSASFGVALYTPGLGVESLLAQADERLYRGKNRGRNRVESGD